MHELADSEALSVALRAGESGAARALSRPAEEVLVDPAPPVAPRAEPKLSRPTVESRGDAEPSALGLLTDDALLARQRELVVTRRRIDADLAAIAGEIARRSDRSLGFGGLAARLGVRTPEQLVARETGISVREAGALVRIGSASVDGGPGAIVGAAVREGAVSIAAADEIVRGIGVATDAVETRELEQAVTQLLGETAGRTAESLGDAARDARAELDAAAVQTQERALRAQRSLRMHAQADGMTKLIAMLDPESAAHVRAVFDAITSPRRGGPRFVARGGVAHAERLSRDPRSTEQLALDGFVELLRLGADVDPGAVVGAMRPAVRIHVRDADLRARGLDPATGERIAAAALDPATGERIAAPALDPATGEHIAALPLDPATGETFTGRIDPTAGAQIATGIDPATGRPFAGLGLAIIEGQRVPVSLATVERAICSTGAVPIHFDFSGQVVNVGRDQRLFTSRQRIGLAARDGGCIWSGCERPPSWCEAHHIDEWRAHGGRTDLADGVLLCRFHHLFVHDRGWRITRGSGAAAATYQAIPPANDDPTRTPIPLPAKHRLNRRITP